MGSRKTKRMCGKRWEGHTRKQRAKKAHKLFHIDLTTTGIVPKTSSGLAPVTNPGLSQGQPDQKLGRHREGRREGVELLKELHRLLKNPPPS